MEIIDPRLAHQISSVLRMKEGERFIGLDNSGSEYIVELKEIKKGFISGQIIDLYQSENEPSEIITLYQALPKQMARLEFVLQKGTELGVKSFVPIITDRTERRDFSNRNRLEMIVKEAAEQCGRAVLPEIQKISFFKDILVSPPAGENLLAYEGENQLILSSLRPHLYMKKPINIFIGPEGGLTPEEVKEADSKDFKIFSLGKLILRTETAGIAVISALRFS